MRGRRMLSITLMVSVSRVRRRNSNAHDHDFRGFNESGGSLALFEVHLARGVRRNNGRNALPADRKFHLRQQSAVAHFDDPADQLISPADAAKAPAPGQHVFFLHARQKPLNFRSGNAVMASGGLHAAQLFLVDPLLERGIADSQRARGVAGVEQFVGAHGHLQKIHLYSNYQDMSIRINTMLEKTTAGSPNGKSGYSSGTNASKTLPGMPPFRGYPELTNIMPSTMTG